MTRYAAAGWVLLVATGCSSAKAPTVRRDGGSGTDLGGGGDGSDADETATDDTGPTDAGKVDDQPDVVPPTDHGTGPCPSGQTSCEGACVDTTNDSMHCGACGHRCALTNATSECQASVCRVVTCASGYGDCDGSPANGCEVNTMTGDATNCGTCERACGGAPCVEGMCQPAFLANAQSEPMAIVAQGGRVYYTCWGDGTVRSVRADGTAPQLHTTGQTQPNQIAVDDSGVYWTNLNGAPRVFGCRGGRTGSACTTIFTATVSGSDTPSALAMDDANLYWRDSASPAHLWTAPKAGVGGTQIGTLSDGGSNFALSDGRLYWAQCCGTTSSIVEFTLLSRTTRTIVMTSAPRIVAVDATHVYFDSGGSLRRVPRAGGAVDTLASVGIVRAIVVDRGDVIWLENDPVTNAPRIVRRVADGTTRVLVEAPDIRRFAVDEANVYFTRPDAVLRVPR